MDDEKEYYSLTRRVFGILAPFYDAITLPISGLRERVVDIADPKKGSKILDVATGTGKQAFAFARRGYDVVGVDISEDMLEVAKRNNRYGNNMRFEVADATRLKGFRNNSFDVSCVSFALHDMPPSVREKVLKEMVRVTKPKGTVMIVDYALPKNAIGRFLVYHFVAIYERLYYPEFIKSDLGALLGKCGIDVKREIPVLLGAGRIVKGMKMRRR